MFRSLLWFLRKAISILASFVGFVNTCYAKDMFNQTEKKIAQNTVINLIGRITSSILGLLGIAIMARYLGVEKFGAFVTIVAFLQFFGILVEFGFSLTTVQMISQPGLSKEEENKILGNIITLRVVSAGIFLALAPLVALFFPYSNLIKFGIAITVFSFYFLSINQIFVAYFQKALKMIAVTVSENVGRLILVLGLAAAAYFDWGLLIMLVWLIAGNFINALINFWWSKKWISWKFQLDKKVCKEIFKRTWPLALSISFNLMYLKTDIIILSVFRSQEEVGLYGATYRIIDVMTTVPIMLMGVALPVLTRYWSENKQDFKNLIQKIWDIFLMLALPVIFGTWIIADKVMVFVAGVDFVAAGDILRILSIAIAAIFLTGLTGYGVVAVHKQKKMMWGYLVVAVLTLIGYFLVIPEYGYIGAAWLTVFSEILILFLTGFVLWRATNFFPKFKVLPKSFLATAAMFVILERTLDWHVLLLVLQAFVIYFGILLLTGALKKQTILELLKLKK